MTYLPFIAGAWGAGAFVVTGLIIWLVVDYRSLSRSISDLKEPPL